MDEAYEAVRLEWARRYTGTGSPRLRGPPRPSSGSRPDEPILPPHGGHNAVDAVSHSRTALPRTHPTHGELDPAAVAAESAAQLRLLRDVLGRPDGIPPSEVEDWLGWHGGLVPKLAASIYNDRAFDGCPYWATPSRTPAARTRTCFVHCRGPGPHTRGCWVVDLLLGKE